MLRKVIIITIAILGIAACGGGNSTDAATKCFENALANQSIGSGTTNCADSTAYNVMQSSSGSKINVTCTHKNGNEYICDVTGPGTQSIQNGGLNTVQGGFYDVTYDGKSIVYQPTQ